MRTVDFYIFSTCDEKKIFHFVCQLAEKLYDQNHNIYFYMQSIEQARTLDQILWTWRADSFLPHNLEEESLDPASPLQIGSGNFLPMHRDILINFNQKLSDAHLTFSRIIEIISADETIQHMARKRYRFYRDQHDTLNTYKPNLTEVTL